MIDQPENNVAAIDDQELDTVNGGGERMVPSGSGLIFIVTVDNKPTTPGSVTSATYDNTGRLDRQPPNA